MPFVPQAYHLNIIALRGSSVLDPFGDESGCPRQTSGRVPMVDEAQGHAPDESPDERWNALEELDAWLQTPMLVLSFLWLVLVVVELVWGSFDALETFGTAIWIAFLIEFAVRLALAPGKVAFLSRNWITVIALIVPAFRLFRAFRIVRVARAARGLRLVRIVGTANRGMNALRASLSRRGLGYVTGLTVLVAFLGAGGMLAFEPASQVDGGFESYPDALWWTGMLLATMGSEFWPRTPEGRILCFLLAVYGFAVFGYITASFASFFVGRDAASEEGEVAGTREIAALRAEIAALRRDLQAGVQTSDLSSN
jgi:voltage-gated potassium channel